jgi:hypothetical protein
MIPPILFPDAKFPVLIAEIGLGKIGYFILIFHIYPKNFTCRQVQIGLAIA